MITLRDIQKINQQRAQRWHPSGIEEWSPLEWAGAMAGEAGEACNAAKKLKRLVGRLRSINLGDRDLVTKAQAERAIAEEAADTIIYAILLITRVGLDAEVVIQQVFNKKSEEYGFPERL